MHAAPIAMAVQHLWRRIPRKSQDLCFVPHTCGLLTSEWLQVGVGAPDCFQRNVLLVNNTFQPAVEVVQGSLLQVPSLP